VPQAIVIALFVALNLHDAMLADRVLDAASILPLATLVVGGSAALWLAFHAVAWRAGRRVDSEGRIEAIIAADRWLAAIRAVGAGMVLYAILFLGWLDVIRTHLGDYVLFDELIAISPALLLIVGTWWSMEPLERRIREAMLWQTLHQPAGAPFHPPLSRWEAVWHHVRHGMLFVLCVLSLIWAWEELLFMHAPPTQPRWWEQWGFETARWSGVVVILLASPLLARIVWSTVRISDGELRDQVIAAVRRHDVRVRGPLLWRTHGTMLNAAILGLLYPFRYLLLTDALVERLARDEVEGVIAHEVAHVRHRHLLWLALAVLTSAILSGWAVGSALHLAGIDDPSGTWSGLGTLALVVLLVGFVSRRFEWQADAFAVRHLSAPHDVVTPQAADTMCRALRRVASFNGIPLTKFGFRHGSIRQRQRRLESLVGRPVDSLPIDTQVRVIKAVTLVLLVVAIVLWIALSLILQTW
jgi:STE24 endopeptidase